MVGLSVVLEGYKDITKKTHQVINKASMSMIKSSSPSSSPTPPSSPSPFAKRNPFNLSYSYTTSTTTSTCASLAKTGFLDHCFLCEQKLMPGKDIYMYKGDRAFCSEECRCRQIFMDEDEIVKAKTDHCLLAAAASPSSRKGAKNRANGFAY